MTQNKSFAELAMDQIRIPSDASAVTTTLSKSLKDGEVLADDGNSYSSVQTAENNASSWIKLSPVTFPEAVTVDTVGLSVVGSGFDTVVDGGTTGDAIQVTSSDVTIKQLAVSTTSGGGNSFDGVVVPSGSSATGVVYKNLLCNQSDSDAFRFADGSYHMCKSVRAGSNVDLNGIAPFNSTNITISDSILDGTNDTSLNMVSNSEDYSLSNIISRNSGNTGIDLHGNDSVMCGVRVIGSSSSGVTVSGTDNLIADGRISGSGGTDFVDNGTSTLVAQDDSANSTIITDDTSGQQSS